MRDILEFILAMPWWYRILVAVLVIWLSFVSSEDLWFHATGHTFWPVTTP